MHGGRAAKNEFSRALYFPIYFRWIGVFSSSFSCYRYYFPVGVLFFRFAVFPLEDRPGRFCFCPLLFSPAIIYTDILQRGPRLFCPAFYASLRSSLRSPSLDRVGVLCFVRRCFVRCPARIIYADIYYYRCNAAGGGCFYCFRKNIFARRFCRSCYIHFMQKGLIMCCIWFFFFRSIHGMYKIYTLPKKFKINNHFSSLESLIFQGFSAACIYIKLILL